MQTLDLSQWPAVDQTLLSDSKLGIYRKRVAPIVAIAHGASAAAAGRMYSVDAQHLRRLMRSCLRIHPDGRHWGFRALIPYIHKKAYTARVCSRRSASKYGGHSGQFSRLMSDYPDVARQIIAYLLKRRAGAVVHRPRIPLRDLHKIFLRLLREAGVLPSDYPFCTQFLAKRALGVFAKAVWHSNYQAATAARAGSQALCTLLHSGRSGPSKLPETPFSSVQFDGHRIDAFFTITVPTPSGTYIEVAVDLLWLLVILDVSTRCILGWHLSLSPQYTSEDILCTFDSALRPADPLQFSIPNFSYPAGGGMPSAVFPTCAWALFGEVCCDNALAHRSTDFQQNLKDLGISVNFGPAKVPQARGAIEAFFRYFEENATHQLPSTVGSGPNDPRRARKPDQEAVRHRISLRHLTEIIELSIAKYHVTSHEALHGNSPFEHLRQSLEAGLPLRTVPEEKRGNFSLLVKRVRCRVKGSLKAGRRPYINLLGTRYTSALLSASPSLIGQYVTVQINLNDLRTVRAFLDKTGAEFDTLTAAGGWAHTAHDIRTRRAILALRKRKEIDYASDENPVEIYLAFLAKASKKSKKAAKAYARAAGLGARSPGLLPVLKGTAPAVPKPISRLPQLPPPKLLHLAPSPAAKPVQARRCAVVRL